MGLIDRFLDKIIFVDTAPFIYLIEENPEYHTNLVKVFELAEDNVQFHTSVLTVLEVLVLPLKKKNQKLADQYVEILTNSLNISVFEIDLNISKRAAEMRAEYNLKTPDAIQIATALENKADVFLTNDLRLEKVK